MYRVPGYAEQMRSKYRDDFGILDAARVLGDEFMTASGPVPTRRPVEAVLRTLFTRMYNLLGAATILLEEGYGIEAGALTRGLMEHFFDVCYIANQSQSLEEADALARRFINHQYVARYLNIKNAKEADMTLRPREYQMAEEERQKHWDNEYGWGKGMYPHDWTGLRPEAKAKAGGAEKIHKWLNHHFSRMVHGGWEAHAQQVIEDEGGKAFLIGQQEALIKLPMPALGILFAHAVQIIAGLLGLHDIEANAAATTRSINERLKTMNMAV